MSNLNVRVWQSLLYPISCIQLANGFWAIVIKGTLQNVLHSEEGSFIVFGSEAEAKDSFNKIKEIRADYRKHGTNPIKINM